MSPTAHEDTPMPPRLLPSLLHRLIAALRIERPWHPGLIRGGPGRPGAAAEADQAAAEPGESIGYPSARRRVACGATALQEPAHPDGERSPPR